MDYGYIKLWRNINKNEVLANDNNAWVVFTRLLTLVDRRTGSYTTGRKKLAVYMNMNENTLYSVLKRLEAATILQCNSNKHATTFSICNWGKWQQTDNEVAMDSQASDNTKQEREEEREVNTYKESSTKKAYLKILNEVTGRNFRIYPNEKRSRDTPRAFKPDEVRTALERMKLDNWHKSRLSQLSAGYLLATENIDKFLNYKTVAEQSISGDRAVPLDDRQQYKREYGVKV